MIKIDSEKCIGCGACVSDCLLNSLTVKNKKAVFNGSCIGCGHCAAVCPKSAVSLPEYDMADVEEYDPSRFCLDADKLLRTVKFRRSIRRYQPRVIEEEKLQRIFQAGRYTATAVNRQDCRFILISEQLSQLKKMIWDGIGAALSLPEEKQPQGTSMYQKLYSRYQADPADDFLFQNAPAVLFIAADVPTDAGLSAQNMELAAVTQGLGTLYNGYLLRAAQTNPAVLSWLNTEDKPLAVCMLLGYPAVTYLRTAPRKEADIIRK